ncbi:MAG: hypothetical protein ABSC51_02420 [Gaiellaceae bacterium]|jgi:hypothetical protein
MMGARAVLVAVLVLASGVGATTSPRLPGAPKCPLFPASNVWNKRIDKLPVAANSQAIIGSIGLDVGLHPDFGTVWNGHPNGIPYTIASKKTKRYRVSFDYASESDKGPYPIPANVKIEGGSDHHALIVDRDSCRLYELYALKKTGKGWHAGSGAIWNLRSNKLRPATWTSADAAGLPMLPGLVRYDEVAHGHIDHALRFTVENTRRAFIYPARHFASDQTDPNLPPMGLRVRLRASFDISGFPRPVRVILTALKRYGMIVADNGANWYISGAPDPRWNDDALHAISAVMGSNFEVVDTSSLRSG